jgi:hypothetical protein
MKKGRRYRVRTHREAFAFGMLGFLITSAVLIYPMLQGFS